MFRDDSQRAEVCNAFLRHYGQPSLFSREGPSLEALEYSRSGYPGSRKQADFFRVAWALWNSKSDVGFLELLSGLDQRSLEFLAGFVLAQGRADGIDAWLAALPKAAWLGAD